MAAVAAPAPAALHPRAAAFTARGARDRAADRAALRRQPGSRSIAAMGVLGLIMRLTQATVIGLSPGLVLPAADAARRRDDHRQPARDDGRALVRAARERAAAARADARRPMRSTIAGVLAVLVATLVGGFGAGWTFLPPLPFYPGRAVVGLVGEPVLRRQRCSSAPASASSASTCSSRRPARYGGLVAHARLALPARARAGGAAAAGDRRDRRRDRRADLLRGRIDDPASACSGAPTTTRSGSTPWSRRTSSTSSATRSRT